MAFVPTEEQQAVREAFATGDRVAVTAMAGTGKTSTLKLCAEDAPNRRMTYVAFNRAIADEARRKFPSSVIAKTMHGFAFAAVGHRYENRLNGPRVRPAQIVEALRLPGRFEYGTFNLRDRQLARVVMDSVSRFCHSAADKPMPGCIPDIPALDSPEARMALEDFLMPYVVRAWEDLSSPRGQLRFTHDVYLKLYAMMSPTLPGEVVLADEWQDADPVIRQIVEGQDKQIIAVGDQFQQIYAWRGAVDALTKFDAPHRLPLQQSFRFGPEIAAEANRALALLQSPLEVVGTPTIESRLAHLHDPDVFLTRTNAEAISLMMRAQVKDVKAGLVGGTGAVESLANAALELSSGQKTTHPELLAFDSWAQVQEFVSEDKDAKELATLVKLVDTHGAETLLAAVQRAVPEQHAQLVISTAHKAKGREWARVRLASDFPHPYDPELGGVDKGEIRLAYVAITRAQHYLDSSPLSWLEQVAGAKAKAAAAAAPIEERFDGVELKPGHLGYRVFLDGDEIPDRPAKELAPEPEPLGRPGEQLVCDPSSITQLLFRGTRYDPALVEAQKGLPGSRYYGEYQGELKVRMVSASFQAIEVARRFGLVIAPEVEARVQELAGV